MGYKRYGKLIVLVFLGMCFDTYGQDTLIMDIDKTVGGCPINHPNKEIIYARTNCGNAPVISEDSVLSYNTNQGVKVIILNYFGVLKEGEEPVKYRSIEYRMSNGHIDFRSDIVSQPYYPVYIMTTATDSSSTTIRYFQNGQKDSEVITQHPKGRKYFEDDSTVIRYETYFNEDGSFAAKSRYQGDKLNGDYFMYDDSTFVTHWVFRDGELVDVINSNCRFLNGKGIPIKKGTFFEQMNTPEFGYWGYHIFEKTGPYSKLVCCDYVLYSDKYEFQYEGKKAERLVKRLNKTCSWK